MTSIRLLLCAACTAAFVGPLPAAPRATPGTPNRFVDLFRPARTELAALSPDGKFLAYTLREADQLSVLVVAIDNPGMAMAKVPVVSDRLATSHFSNDDEPTPARINWMKWVTPSRLAVESNAQVSIGERESLPGIVLAFNADGSDAGILLTPRDVRELVSPAAMQSNTVRDRAPLAPTVDDPHFAAGGTAQVIDDARNADPGEQVQLFVPGNPVGAMDPSLAVPDDRPTLTSLTPRIFDLDPANPGSVLVRTVGKNGVSLYRLDVTTAKLSRVSEHAFEDDRASLLDRQGRPRISAPNIGSIGFPHRLTLDRGPGSKRSRDLSTAAGLAADAAFIVSPENFFAHRAVPLGFDERPEILYYASNVGRDTYALYGVDLTTGHPIDFAMEHPSLDLIDRPAGSFGPAESLVYDRHTRRMVGIRLTDRLRSTRWIDADLQAAQALLEKSLPGRSVEITDWDTRRRILLAWVGGPTEPGGIVVLNRTTGKLTEFARRAPWLDSLARNRSVTMDVQVAPGVELPCRITFPANPRVRPQPLIVICPSAPWERIAVDFQPEIQALADMGFAVLQVSSRGAWGHGVLRRESIRDGYEDAQVNDVLRVVDEVGRAFAVDPARVGIIGVGHGGYLAVRAMQVAPTRFRCGVVLDPIVNLRKWVNDNHWESAALEAQFVRSFYSPRGQLADNPVVRDAGRIMKPLLIFSYPGRDGETRRNEYISAQAFAQAVRRPDVEVEFRDFSPEAKAGLPRARGGVYQEIEYFLNTHCYDFSVKLGDPVEVKDR